MFLPPQLHSMLLPKSDLEWELLIPVPGGMLKLLSLIVFPIPLELEGLDFHHVVGSSFILHSWHMIKLGAQ